MKLSLWYPIKPFHLNQGFGENPQYYAKFHDDFGNPMKGHDGWDFMGTHGQPVYAPMDGIARYTTDNHGGQGVILNSNGTYEVENGTCWIQIMLWHLVGDTDPKFPKPFDTETQVKKGDLVGYANNTGAPYESTGDHLHVSLIACDRNFKPVNPGNGFRGRIDPKPYWNNYYAQDYNVVINIYQKLIALYKSL